VPKSALAPGIAWALDARIVSEAGTIAPMSLPSQLIPSIGEILKQATQALEASSTSARLDAELLLAFVLDRPRSYLIAHAEESPSIEGLDVFTGLVLRRRAGEPVAYITGRREFWSMELVVNRHTLIPRPETELLVEQALASLPARDPRVLDIGTGSGALALALARERSDAQVTATDLYAETLGVARYNALRLGIHNVEFLQGSWFEPVAGRRFHLIVCNPPYVAEGDPHLQEDGLTFEPMPALVSGRDGLEAIRVIAGQAPGHLLPGGSLWLEHGNMQAKEVTGILREAGFQGVQTRADLAGHSRISGGTKPGERA